MRTEVSPLTSAVARVATAMTAPTATSLANAPAATAPKGNSSVSATAAPAPTGSLPAGPVTSKPALTTQQKAALKHLHATAQQFESLFVNMLFKSMRAASAQTSITGEKLSPAETTFTEMLDEKRSESLAQTGAFGIAKILEDQLKDSVLANPAQAANARLAPEGIL